MKLGARLNRVLAGMALIQQGATVDYTKDRVSVGDGGHGFHGERGRPPTGAARPLVVQWAERFEHMILAAERDLEAVTHGTEPVEWRGTKPATGLRQRINSGEYDGRDPVFVAFMERCSVELVRKARKEGKRHMVTGYPLEAHERPLTAHPRHTLAELTSEEA